MTTTGVPTFLVLGAGVMGTGIAGLALLHGAGVVLADIDEAALARARAGTADAARMARLVGAAPADLSPGTLSTTTEAAAAVRTRPPTVVIEAVTEDPARKAAVLKDIAAAVPPGTPLISNTSSIPVDELAGGVPRPGDLLGVHFMNPAYLIPTVELIKGPRTSPEAVAGAMAALTALRRTAIVVRDAPGFVTSRLLHPMINDAARVVQEGTASVQDVDTLMQSCLGHRTGPLRTADLIGIDNLVDSLLVLHARTGDERCRPCDLLQEMARDGRHGRKSGRGFYEYTKVG
ncbi:hypothetical protein Asp14428_16890 [Actinoplanes sp. NBRC 14428]|uniref:Methoxymalonate biosynthesis protein n=1 Tax=Pseudosporangium ferrugineum TaxID=439699 RepID=A0A2T0SB66_9ACTN|nr:3-hydroxyacyl-CoA dehydrogenase family protein [Pseudosporangium ferrugineum]PRY30669.1 methoxymalonate biosynthesis protein [Pseudosporangium ferrugineum]BCJ50214.1 hypothetical protein Asp14428_16890 [Actinoplanes sp. NBRC 14428]